MAKLEIDDIRKLRSSGESEWADSHTNYRDWTRFSHGVKDSQWDTEVLSARKTAQRPCQQYNIVAGFIRPTVNALKECPPEINVYPVSQADKRGATLISGAMRAIQYHSNASRAYLHALDCCMRGGLGAWRITPKKIRGKIQILIEAVEDPTCIIIGPCRQIDYSDAPWVMTKTYVPEAEYKRIWPTGSGAVNDGRVEVWETWYECVETLADGEEEIRVEHYLDDGIAILSHKANYLGTMIPLVFVTGPSAIVDDKKQFLPITYDIAPMQKEINWLKSEAVAQVASWPKANFKAPRKAVEKNLEDWENAATSPNAVLIYDGDKVPDEIEPPPPPTGYMALTEASMEMSRQVTGIYPDPTLQAKADAPSGKAIKAQRMGSGIANYHYVDAINYGMKRTGEILLELIAKYLNDDDVRISLGADNSVTHVSFGPTDVENVSNLDLTQGTYGVTIATGPSYASQREELIDKVIELVGADPKQRALIADWVLMQLPIPGVEDAAERLRLALPPDIQKAIAAKKSGDPEEQMLNMRQEINNLGGQMQQAQQIIQQLTAALKHETTEHAQFKASKEQENATRLQIAQEGNATAIQLQEMKSESELEKLSHQTVAKLTTDHLAHERGESKKQEQAEHE